VGEAFAVAASETIEAALADSAVEAVVIASPPATHPELITLAARAGKHVLCEKPLAYELGPARAAVDEARRCGVTLQVGFHRRHDADYVEAKSRIDAGELGRPLVFRDSMRDQLAPPDEVLRGERLLHDATSHDFDCARWLVGEIAAVTAVGTQLSPIYREIGDVDNVVIALEFANGAIGAIDNSRAVAYGFDCQTELVGSSATVRVADPRRRRLEWLSAEGVALDHALTFLDRFRPAYVDELEAFCRSALDGTPPNGTGEDGMQAIAIAAAVEESMASGRKVRVTPVHQHEGDLSQ